MKKLLAMMLVFVLALSFCGCDNDSDTPKNKNKSHVKTTKSKLLCAENVDYIKSVDQDVTVTICSPKKSYVSYMEYMAELYGISTISEDEVECFEMTQDMLGEYHKFNDKISIEYVDPESTQFTDIAAKYVDEYPSYGDMIVTSSATEKYKILRFEDIYVTTKDSTGVLYTLFANQLETALTNAISFVTNTDNKKVAVLTGHSSNYSDTYIKWLGDNYYEVKKIPDRNIAEIQDDYDLIVIAAPVDDFTNSELDVISDFLDNDGKLGKGLVFFADAAAPNLPNLYGFLKQWGIEVSEGKLYETDPHYMSTTTHPDIMALVPNVWSDSNDSEIISAHSKVATGNNVPMKACNPSTNERTTKVFLQTSPSAVIVPKYASSTWTGYTEDDKQQFDCVIQSKETSFNRDNNEISSYIMAFSSVEFIDSQWAEDSALDNEELVLNCTNRAAHTDNDAMVFPAKVVEKGKQETESKK